MGCKNTLTIFNSKTRRIFFRVGDMFIDHELKPFFKFLNCSSLEGNQIIDVFNFSEENLILITILYQSDKRFVCQYFLYNIYFLYREICKLINSKVLKISVLKTIDSEKRFG